ncbi:hypothetical protein EON64_15250, partial [archaeon]
ACQSGQADSVALLLRHGADPGVKDKNGDTALHIAAEQGRVSILSLLLDRASSRQGRLKVNTRNKKGQHALMLASSRQVAQMLVDCGADVTVADCNGRDAVGYAALRGKGALLRYLLSANIPPRRNRTEGDVLCFEAKVVKADYILHDVVRARRPKCLEVLLGYEYYHDLVDLGDHLGYTPLLYAAKIGDKKMCAMLIQANSDIYHQAHNGHSLYSLLVSHRHLDCLFQLSGQLRKITASQQDQTFTLSHALHSTPFKHLLGIRPTDEVFGDLFAFYLSSLSRLLLTGLSLDVKVSSALFGPSTLQVLSMLCISTSLRLLVRPEAECMRDFFPGLQCAPSCITLHWPQDGSIRIHLTMSCIMVTHRHTLSPDSDSSDTSPTTVDLLDLPTEVACLVANHIHHHPGIWPYAYKTPAYLNQIHIAASRLGWSTLQTACAVRRERPTSTTESMMHTKGFLAACHECFVDSCKVKRISACHTCCLSVLGARDAIEASPLKLWYVLYNLVDIVSRENETFELLHTVARWHTNDQGQSFLVLIMHGLDCCCLCFPNITLVPLSPLPLPSTRTLRLLSREGALCLDAVEEVFCWLFHRLRLYHKAQEHGDVIFASSDSQSLRLHRSMLVHCPKLQAMMHFAGEQASEFLVTMSFEVLRALAIYLYTSLLPPMLTLDALLEVAA